MLRVIAVVLMLLVCSSPLLAQTHDESAMPPGQTGPSIHFQGFTNIDFSLTDDQDSPDGFSLGQFAGHVSVALSPKVSFFGETSVTARNTGFTVEMERLILRWDYNDRLKVSVGKYHTPINYWNTAYHHGLWLQTTISRPEMIQMGGTFQPVHFVGVLVEGTVGPPSIGLGYNAGVGNGRGDIISRAGDAGDANRNAAWLTKLYARPASFTGFEVGGSVYHDKVPAAGTPGYPELITGAYVALTRELPEVIAEFTNVRHQDSAHAIDANSQAFYVQFAARIPQAPSFKPYARFEQLFGEPLDPVLGDHSSRTLTLGLRYELTDMSAVKAEYRHFRRPDGHPVDGFYAQVALAF
jgi:hypothetical protein